MPQKSVVLDKFKLKQSSLFDLDELYKIMFRWFENAGYSFYEKLYQDIDTPTGKIIQVFWTAERKMDDYVKYVIDINFNVTGLSKVDIERGGVKTSTSKGSVEFRITATLLKDYDNKWSATPFMKNIRKFYDQHLIRARLERLEGEIYGEVSGLIDEIKTFLALHKF
jgi:hypothetical protein